MTAPRPARPSDGPAWITGASSGIGMAVARRLLAEGWTVGVTARSPAPLEALAAEFPGRVVAAPGDVTDRAAMRAAVDKTEATLGGPVALAILCAGAWQQMGAPDFDLDGFRRTVSVNLDGTATALCAVLAPMMARRTGQIAIVASVAGYRGLPNAAAYGPTKAALIAMAESLKFDLDRAGVMINVVNPGFVRTPMTDRNRFPMPMIMEPAEAAARIVAGLSRGGFEVAFPWQLAAILKALRLLPARLYFALVGWGTRGRK